MTTKNETEATTTETKAPEQAAKTPKLKYARYFLFMAPVISMTAGYITGQYATAIQSVLS
ncbi:MAG: hypothetical protein ACRBBN_20895 [Methyloligellaceae bacterium]